MPACYNLFNRSLTDPFSNKLCRHTAVNLIYLKLNWSYKHTHESEANYNHIRMHDETKRHAVDTVIMDVIDTRGRPEAPTCAIKQKRSSLLTSSLFIITFLLSTCDICVSENGSGEKWGIEVRDKENIEVKKWMRHALCLIIHTIWYVKSSMSNK